MSFFAVSDVLYVETLPFTNNRGSNDQQHVLINLPTGKFEERVSPYIGVRYSALSEGRLLGYQYDNAGDTSQMILATLPDYKEIARVPYAVTQEREARNRDTGEFVSADRKSFLYGAGHSMVCRRTEDLGLVWTRPIEADLFGARAFSLTPDGGIVAAAVMDTMFIANQRNCYVGIFEGRDGSPMARLHLNGNECISISPDGKLLAVGERVALQTGEMQPTVNLYAVPSGQQVATVIHDRLRVGRGDFGNDAINCEFAPDGKYLITSSIHTKVWAL